MEPSGKSRREVFGDWRELCWQAQLDSSSQKNKAIRELRCAPVVKNNGFGRTDFSAEIWHPTWSQKAIRGILQLYAEGDTARKISAMDPGAYAELMPGQMFSVLPHLGAPEGRI